MSGMRSAVAPRREALPAGPGHIYILTRRPGPRQRAQTLTAPDGNLRGKEHSTVAVLMHAFAMAAGVCVRLCACFLLGWCMSLASACFLLVWCMRLAVSACAALARARPCCVHAWTRCVILVG